MTTSVLNQHVLVLNRSWVPLHVTTVRRALLMLVTDQALALDANYATYDFESWSELSRATRGGRRIATVATEILVPYVVVLTGFNRVPPRSVRLSRRNIFARDRGICQYCGCRPTRDEVSIDHVIPRSRGGTSTWENLVLACTACNRKKGNRLLSECGMELRRQPTRPRGPITGPVRIDREGRGFWERFVSRAYWDTVLEE